MKQSLALRCVALTLVAGLAFVVACEEKAPPPVPGGGSSSGGGTGDPARAARQVRDMVKGTEAAIKDEQQRAVDAANDNAMGNGSQAGKEFPVSGVLFTVQPGWTARPVSGMRRADLEYKGSAGTVHAIFYAEGGTADDNINRWARQIEVEGVDQPKRNTESVNGLQITRFDARGTYRGMTPLGTTADPEPNNRFIGVVIEGGSGSVQIRLVGPEQVVNEAVSGFNAMLSSIKKN